MNKTSMIHIRVQPDVKTKAEKILAELGMSTTEAVNIYLKQIILNEGLPFEVKIPRITDDFAEAIEEASKIAEEPEKYKSYKNLAEIMEELDNE